MVYLKITRLSKVVTAIEAGKTHPLLPEASNSVVDMSPSIPTPRDIDPLRFNQRAFQVFPTFQPFSKKGKYEDTTQYIGKVKDSTLRPNIPITKGRS